MTMSQSRQFKSVVKLGVLAGLAGGLAEILWIWLYAALTGVDPAGIARGVSAAIGIETSSVASGIAIHMALAAALGAFLALVLTPLLGQLSGRAGRYAIVLAALALVWAVNFWLVLPRLSPPFVQIVPYEVSLLSKLLFGLSAAMVLDVNRRRARATATVRAERHARSRKSFF